MQFREKRPRCLSRHGKVVSVMSYGLREQKLTNLRYCLRKAPDRELHQRERHRARDWRRLDSRRFDRPTNLARRTTTTTNSHFHTFTSWCLSRRVGCPGIGDVYSSAKSGADKTRAQHRSVPARRRCQGHCTPYTRTRRSPGSPFQGQHRIKSSADQRRCDASR